MSAFKRLHREIQRWIYEQGWGSLRHIQAETIIQWATTADDMIISAPTAGGKTEAAFLPVLSAIAERPCQGVRAIYVGPLRALINDQFRRCEQLCEAAEISVHRWHGDVRNSERKHLVRDPSGVLLITPESIESLLINRSTEVRRIFSDPLAIVIDELHVYPSTDRGLHLRSLLHRLDHLAGRRIRRIGLSATLGDPTVVAAWLYPTQPDRVRIISDQRAPRTLHARIHGYVNTQPRNTGTTADDGARQREPEPPQALTTPSGMPTTWRLLADLWRHHPQGINLIFGNSRTHLESCAVGLRALLREERIPEDRVLIHHGSLSRDIREEAEQLLQQGGHRLCLCTSTLELGLDIGAVQAVGQLNAPWSVASLAQRVGRSGRRAGEVPTIRHYIYVEDTDDTLPVVQDPGRSLELELIRAIAVLSLHLEHWCEPLDTLIRDLTVRIQQTLSLIAQHNGMRAADLYGVLASADGVGTVSSADYADLLRHLGAQDILEQLSNGELLIGTRGQPIVNGRDFYAVFQSTETYRVVHDGRLIGTIPEQTLFAAGNALTLAGRTWCVQDIDQGRRTLHVQPGHGHKPLYFAGGRQQLHQHVVTRMRALLSRTHTVDGLLDTSAQRAYVAACATYEQLGLGTAITTRVGDSTFLWTWLGGPANLALALLLRVAGYVTETYDVGIFCECALDIDPLYRAASAVTDEQLLKYLANAGLPLSGKYDHLAPPVQLAAQFVARDIDVPTARAWLETTASPSRITKRF